MFATTPAKCVACMMGAAVLVLAAGSSPAQPPDRPNIVLVVADDLGYGDLGCYGNAVIKTPHLDRFARQGLRLTSCYAAAANCSPARTGLMTGRTPYRAGIHNWIPWGSPMHVRASEVTVASLLRRAGYATCLSGKWHLNGRLDDDAQPQPSDHGFDYWFATQNNALPNHHEPDNFVRNGEAVGPTEGYSAQIVVDEALAWLDSTRDRARPFFLYVCFHEPHEPIATDARFAGQYASEGDRSRAAHHGNITQMDDAFGRLMRKLDDDGLADGTLVFFTSDNGPAITARHPHGSAGPLRGKKGMLYEGGIRVPGLVRWPGRVAEGSQSDEPVSGVDVFPTLCEVAGIDRPAGRDVDGTSFLPLLTGRPLARGTPLYWQFNVAQDSPKVAMRVGRWKILAHLSGPEIKPFGDLRPEDQSAIKTAELDRFELYDLAADLGETRDLAAAEPARTAELASRLRRMYAEVREESPTWPAWTWPRFEAGRIRYPDLGPD